MIDLSELGSDEAIALMMGVLIMKLNEYRKSQRKANPKLALNSELKHVTVLRKRITFETYLKRSESRGRKHGG